MSIRKINPQNIMQNEPAKKAIFRRSNYMSCIAIEAQIPEIKNPKNKPKFLQLVALLTDIQIGLGSFASHQSANQLNFNKLERI